MAETALIVGAGSGLSASLARLFAKNGMRVALAARDAGKLNALTAETGARAYGCDATKPDAVDALFEAVARDIAVPGIVVHNASFRTRGPAAELDREAVKQTLMVTAYGGFLVAQRAVQGMLKLGHGTILLTGASASVKGYAQSAPFAMGKFALRGLAQSLARELQPKNIHVAHVVIDGGIRRTPNLSNVRDPRAQDRGEDGLLEPDAIARTYLDLHRQHRSAWSWEIELRPWVEKF